MHKYASDPSDHLSGCVSGLLGAGVGVRATLFYWSYYTLSFHPPDLQPPPACTGSLPSYLYLLLRQSLSTCVYLTGLHSLPALLKLNNLPRPLAHASLFLLFAGADMRPEIGAALPGGGMAGESWRLAGGVIGAVAAGRARRRFFP